jgi:ATP-independent RNA helicase DbpA
MKPFDAIPDIPAELIANLNELGFIAMTPIQEAALAPLLKGKDVIAQAKTGSGKTAAFGIPLIGKIDTKRRDPQALVLCPTRELADQVANELRRLARYKQNLKILTLCGGTPLTPQAASLAKGAHILVGTPGRVQDHLSRETIVLKHIHTLVLDEADRMLDMGFYDAIVKIISNIPKNRQSMLFSATYPEKIQTLSKEILRDPLMIQVDTDHDRNIIQEIAYEVQPRSKNDALISILKAYRPTSAMIFCNTKLDTITLTDFLRSKGISALDLHGDLEQRERNETLLQFANGSVRVMIATDVASRGLDIKDVAMVINCDLPHGDESYTHRIGRTARAGAKGIAISLYTAGQKEKLRELSSSISFHQLEKLSFARDTLLDTDTRTMCIGGGKKDKVSRGDILGALCKEIGIGAGSIGKIDITDRFSYIAIDKKELQKALDGLKKEKIKGKKFNAWKLD